MKRREFIMLLGSAAAWPIAAWAQQPAKLPTIGFISTRTSGDSAAVIAAFHQGLNQAGYSDWQDVAIEYRWAEGQYDRLPALAADLVRSKVSVIVAAGGDPAAQAAKAATATIPIVFEMGSDPVWLGLVASLNRPGGNVTGVTQLNIVVAPKRLELLHELVPTATAMVLLIDPTDPAVVEATTRDLQAAARNLGLELHILNASTEAEFEPVFAKVIQLRAGGLVLGAGFFTARAEQLAALALRYGVPTVYEGRAFVMAGGLASYGGNFTDSYRLAGFYAGRVLKGEKPADLPVVQPTKFELVVNLNTARALGIAIPNTLLALADEVIE